MDTGVRQWLFGGRCAQIVAACDLQSERAGKAAPRGYVSAEEMLDREKLDFLNIATRADSHLPIVRLAVARKIPTILPEAFRAGLGNRGRDGARRVRRRPCDDSRKLALATLALGKTT